MKHDETSSLPPLIKRILQLVLFGAIAALALHCSSTTSVPSPVETPKSSSEPLLLTRTCTFDASNNVTVQVGANEVAYVAKKAGCTSSGEPCVIINALDTHGYPCAVSSTKAITINGAGGSGPEKVALDYSNGFFGIATSTTTLVNVTLDLYPTNTSSVYIVAMSSSGNIYASANGVCVNTLASRGTPYVDVKVTWSSTTPGALGNLTLDGGQGDDVLTGTLHAWPTPTGWTATSTIITNVGSGYAGPLTVNGWAGNDTIGGSASTSTLSGGLGNDLFRQPGFVRVDIMSGGDGIDTVDYGSRSNPLFITISSTSNGEVGENDTINNDIEIVIGGSGNDTMDAHLITQSDVVLFGGGGNDTLTGGGGQGGATELCGGAGDDVFKWAVPGSSYLVGGAGIDTVTYSSALTSTYATLSSSFTSTSPLFAGWPAGQNGPTSTIDISNSSSVNAVCPRPLLRVAQGVSYQTLSTTTTGTNITGSPMAPFVTWLPAGAGGAMASDVENITGPFAYSSTLVCGTLACVVFAGSGDDTIVGSPNSDVIYGGGSSNIGDNVITNGGSDFIDLTHSGGTARTDTVTCGSDTTDNATILANSVDTVTLTTCGAATLNQRYW